MRIAVINAIIGHCDNRLRALQQRECTVHLISRQTMGWLRTDYIVSEGRDALGIPRSIVLLTAIKVTNNLNCKSKVNFASLYTCNTCNVKNNVSVKKIRGELHHDFSRTLIMQIYFAAKENVKEVWIDVRCYYNNIFKIQLWMTKVFFSLQCCSWLKIQIIGTF